MCEKLDAKPESCHASVDQLDPKEIDLQVQDGCKQYFRMAARLNLAMFTSCRTLIEVRRKKQSLKSPVIPIGKEL